MIKFVSSKKFFENLDVICGILGVFFGLIVISLHYIINLNQQSIGLVLTLASFVYLINRSSYINNLSQEVYVKKGLKIYLDILFFFLFFVVNYIYLTQQYNRPLSYFLLVCILTCLIGIEILIFTQNKNVYSILFKIFLLSLFVRIGIYYHSPSIMGYDAYLHSIIIEYISNTGFVPPLNISGKYFYYPLFHIFVSIAQVLINNGIKEAFFGSMILSNIFITIFIFLLGRKIVGYQVSLLGTLLFNINNDSIVYGVTNITPGSLVLCYFLILLYLLFGKEQKFICRNLTVFFVFLMILTHQLTAFVSLLILSSMLIGTYIIKKIQDTKFSTRVTFNYILLFIISLQAYWMNSYVSANKSFFDAVFGPLISVLRSNESYGANLLIVGNEYQNTLLESLTLHFCYLILPLIAIGGVLFWISVINNKYSGDKFSIASSIIILYVFIYGIPLMGVRNLLTDRWTALISILLVIVCSDYIFKLIELINSNKNKVIFMFILLFIFSFLMLITPAINKDNPIVGKNQTINTQFNSPEIYAAKTISSKYPTQILLDSPYVYCFELYSTKNYFDETKDSPNITTFDVDYINSVTNELNGSLILLRKSTLNQLISVSYIKRVPIATKLSTGFFEKFNSTNYYYIYNNGDVLGYYSRACPKLI